MRVFAAVLCLSIATAAPALAQFETASVVGTIRDPSGGVVPEATVTLTNTATGAVIAKVTSASLVIEQETPCALLLYRVNASALSSQRKRPLLATLEAADAPFAAGQCEAAFNNLRTFQNKVRAQVTKTDPVLAEHLLAGSQEIIEAGCAGD